MTIKITCACCSKVIEPKGIKYILDIKSFADFDGILDDDKDENIEEGVKEALHDISMKTEEELEREVYSDNIYILCKLCRDRFIEDPFGPSGKEIDRNLREGSIH